MIADILRLIIETFLKYGFRLRICYQKPRSEYKYTEETLIHDFLFMTDPVVTNEYAKEFLSSYHENDQLKE
jgi:hypothetical protein